MKILRALNYHLGGGGGGGDIAYDALHYAFRSNEKTYKHTALARELPILFGYENADDLLNNLYPGAFDQVQIRILVESFLVLTKHHV